MLVTRNVVTREEVIAAIRELAAKLGRSPRYPEVIRVVNVTRRQIHRMFGGWAAALEESGCERLRVGGAELTMHALWHDWVAVSRKVERMPTIRQYEKFSRYSVRPLRDRFRAWHTIPAAMLEYGDSKGLWAGWEDVRKLIERRVDVWTPGQRCTMAGSPTSPSSPDIAAIGKASAHGSAVELRKHKVPPTYSRALPIHANTGREWGPDSARSLNGRRDDDTFSGCADDGRSERNYEGTRRGLCPAMPEIVDPELLYGEPLNLDPMATAPVNEAGVLFLFGTLARELGFVVLKMQNGFPDCEAWRRLENGKWQRVRIEFEFESRNFVWHGHDVKGCDLIVCWENNWKESPVEILELKKIFTAD